MKQAICIKTINPISGGDLIKYEFHEAYGNEWVDVFNNEGKYLAALSIEKFNEHFKEYK